MLFIIIQTLLCSVAEVVHLPIAWASVAILACTRSEPCRTKRVYAVHREKMQQQFNPSSFLTEYYSGYYYSNYIIMY